MTTPLDPAAWFDQFPPLESSASWPADSQWCPRHWAPCPVLGANGLGAATELISLFVSEIAPPDATSPDALNRAMHNAGRLCCTLGDERMYELWGKWPPSERAAPEAGGAS